MTASQLFSGTRHNPGMHHCLFCGADCDGTYLSKDYVKGTFTNWDVIKYPGSKYVCRGCVEALGLGDDEILMLDGTTKTRKNVFGMAPRMYSWILTKDSRIAFTKTHISLIRDILCGGDIPDPPFAIIMADSGQKHLIFRSPVAMGKNDFPVMLEEEIIQVIPARLKEFIELTTPIVAAIGKPALLKEFNIGIYIAYEKYHGNIEMIEAWQKINHTPLGRLAAWLAKNKEDAQNEYQSN
jgi:hypothetical protein